MVSNFKSSPFEHLPRALKDLDATEFFFLRHGRTDYNFRRLIQGSIDIPLDTVGQQEARAAAKVFQTAGSINHIVASDLARARETATIVGKATGLTVETDGELRERHFGPLGGSPTSPDVWYSRESGVETIEDFAARVASGVRRNVAGDGRLIVAHGGVLRAIAHLLGASLSTEQLSNALPLRIFPGSSGWKIVSLVRATIASKENADVKTVQNYTAE